MNKLAYIAGPLFNEGERWFNELVDRIAQEAGYDTFLPQRDLGILGADQGPDDWLDAASIFKEDTGYLKRADIIIATLNGLQTDDGTAWNWACIRRRQTHRWFVQRSTCSLERGHAKPYDSGELESFVSFVGRTQGIFEQTMNLSNINPRTLVVGILLGGVLGTAIGIVTRDIPVGLLAGMLLGGLFVALSHAAKQER